MYTCVCTLACERVVCTCVSMCICEYVCEGEGLGVICLCSTSVYFCVCCVYVYARMCVGNVMKLRNWEEGPACQGRIFCNCGGS